MAKDQVEERETGNRKIIPLMFRLLNSTGEIAVATLLNDYPCRKTLKRQLNRLNDLYFEWSGKQNYLFEFISEGDQPTEIMNKNGKIRLLNSVVLDQFNIHQLVALHSSNLLSNRNVGDIFDEVNDSIIAGSDQKISSKHKKDLRAIERKFYSYGMGSTDFEARNRIKDPKRWGIEESETVNEILNEIFKGLIHQRKLQVVYKNVKGDEKRYIIRPLTILTYQSSLYLMAQYDWWDADHAPTLLKISNFIMVDVLKKKSEEDKTEIYFEYPENHDPAKFFAEDFGIIRNNKPREGVVLEFDASLFDYLNTKKWAEDQVLSMNDGDTYCTLSFETSNLWEVKSWVLSWGDGCRVVAPASLKKDVVDNLERALSKYPQKIAKVS